MEVPASGYSDLHLIHTLVQSTLPKSTAAELRLVDGAVQLNDAVAIIGHLLGAAPAAVAGLELLGKTDAEKTEVSNWLAFAGSNLRSDGSISGSFVTLNDHLLTRTYVASNHLTAADLSLYALSHSAVEKLSLEDRFAHPALVRWFDLIQNTLPTTAAGVLSHIAFNLEAPAPVKTEQKKEEKPEEAGKPAKQEKAKAAKQEKPKEEKAKEEKPKKDEPAANDKLEPAKLDLRVGLIRVAKKHPDADSLYVEEIELGDATGARTVVSGLVKFIPLDEMQNRKVVCICNLKPASMRGVKSEAMVLCATSVDGNTVEFLEPPQDSQPGDRVYLEGCEGQPEEQLNPKKKVWENVQPHLNTSDDRVARFKDIPFRTSKGVVTVKTVVKGSIK